MTTTNLPSRTFPSNRSSADTYTYNSSDDDDFSTLPHPEPLSREAFLAPSFTPETYLRTLHNRHQTLEDLRTELRQRSQQINRELLDLVNSEYEDFLSLGADLKGGGEKVEGVRVGCLGFGREVEGLRGMVGERAGEVGVLLKERKGLVGEMGLGRGLLEVEERIGELEDELGLGAEGRGRGNDEDEDSDDDESENGETGPLKRQCEQFLLIVRMIERIGLEHPFLQAHKNRVDQLRKTILLDLASALRSAKSSGSTGTILGILKLYAGLGAEKESVRGLKGGG